MATGGLVAEPLDEDAGFNWQFLVFLLACGVLTVFFFYYSNRLFGTLVSYCIRAYTWHRYRAYIDIQALQFSLLGGRIFFKDIRYHAHNETILVHGGHITWRYWLRKVKEAEVFTSESATRPRPSRSASAASVGSLNREEKGGVQTVKPRPCRILVKVSGVEAFLYNRSPAYDSVKAAMSRMAGEDIDDDAGPATANEKREAEWNEDPPTSDPSSPSSPRKRSSRQNTSRSGSTIALPSFLHMFPIQLECNKGAIVVGNENTKCIITARFDSATGEIDAGPAGPLDVYKQIFRVTAEHPVVQIRPNPDFKSPQWDAAARLKNVSEDVSEQDPRLAKGGRAHRTRRALHALRNLSPFFRRSVESLRGFSRGSTKPHAKNGQVQLPGQERWQGLSRYIEENEDEHEEWDSVEYAKSSTMIDCPKLSLSYFWDVPGYVLATPDDEDRLAEATQDINGAPPPDYGLDLVVHGGVITYGPWTDRQRTEFQTYFFPNAYTDAVPSKPLKSGDPRVSTKFKIYISVEQETVVRIPLREPSKDWKWKGRAGTVTGDKSAAQKGKERGKSKRKNAKGKKKEKTISNPNVRPFGWLDLKVYSDSTVSYCMDMVAAKGGYTNNLEVDVKKLEISSSVNHGLVWRSRSFTVEGDLSNPCGWNAMRQWRFDIGTDDLELFLLRDHLFLLTDMIVDWGSGPPPQFYTFTPYRYSLNIEFRKFQLFLNCNDGNIITSPVDLEENNFVVLCGKSLNGHVTIPLENFRPSKNRVPFEVKGIDLGFELCLPSKNTVDTFLGEKKVAYLGELDFSGSHSYFTETLPSLTDTLHFDIRGTKFVLALYGFLIKHFMKIKDNYFGEDMHFRTLDEFQELPPTATPETKQPTSDANKKTNGLDVILNITVSDACALLPAHLYSARQNVRIDIPFTNAELRFTNYYMDMVCNFSPLSLSQSNGSSDPEAPLDSSSPSELFVDAFQIFGHRLFGLPPTEPTYVCNWDFDVGKITGDCSSSFIDKLMSGAKGIGFTFDDDENTLPFSNPPIIHDITFLRLRTDIVRVWLRVDSEAFLISTEAVSLDFNDWAGSTFSQRLNLTVPNLTIACIDASLVSRRRSRKEELTSVPLHAFFQATVGMNMLQRKANFCEERQKQQDHVREQDVRTRRAEFLLRDDHRPDSQPPNPRVMPPSMPFPPIPSPVAFSEGSASGSWADSCHLSTPSLNERPSIRCRASPNRPRKVSSRLASSRSTSSSSLSQSIRSMPYSKSHVKDSPTARSRGGTRTSHSQTQTQTQSSSYTAKGHARPTLETRRSTFSSTVAFSSALLPPQSVLNTVELDLTDVPILPEIANDADTDLLPVDVVPPRSLDEELVHTSFFINVSSGIRASIRPQAISAAMSLMEALQPRQPGDILDDYQLDMLTKIMSSQKRKRGKGKSVELHMRVPCCHIRFCNRWDATHATSGVVGDQYDLILGRLSLALRSRTLSQSDVGASTMSLHTALSSIRMTAKEELSDQPGSAVSAVQGSVDDFLAWLSSSENTTANVAFRAFEVSAAGKKIEYLSGLMERTAVLASDVERKIKTRVEEQKTLLKTVIYHLTVAGSKIPDPPFLTRPSHALRAGRDHLRSEDSWKIVSRFRYIHQCLDEETKRLLNELCTSRQGLCPANAEEWVIQSWDQWRSWDLAHVRTSLAMRTVYGSTDDFEGLRSHKPHALHLEVNAGLVRLVIDPESSRNEFAIQQMVASLDSTPPASPSGLMLLASDRPTRKSTLQVYLRSISLRLDWDICGLVESVLNIVNNSNALEKHNKPDMSGSTDPARKNTREVHSFQVVCTTANASINLETRNLRSTSVACGLQMSLVGTDATDFGEALSASALLHASTASTEIRSHGRYLCLAKSESPSLYISYDKSGPALAKSDEWRFAGATTAILVDVKEEIHGLIEVADAVIQNEVADVLQKAKSFKGIRKPSSRGHLDDKQRPSAPLPLITLALLMDSYTIEVAMLQSLSYSISGRTGQISASPDLRRKFTLNTNFDLDMHTHQIRGYSYRGTDVVAELEIPPINGSAKLFYSRPATHVELSTTIEEINLEASALHGIMTTLNRSEISSALKAIKADIGVVQSRVNDLFPPQSPRPPAKSSDKTAVTYNIHLTLAGLNVRATAPGATSDSAEANIVFSTHSVLLKAANASEDQLRVFPVPEFSVGVQHIGVDLSMSRKGKTRRCGNIALGVSLRCTLDDSASQRDIRLESNGLEINMYADTASAVLDVINHLQDRIKELDLSNENMYLRRLRRTRKRTTTSTSGRFVKTEEGEDGTHRVLVRTTYALEILNIQLAWIVGNSVRAPSYHKEDLVLSFKRIALAAKKENVARLSIEDMQLQMCPTSQDKRVRSMNSALLPEVVFNAAYSKGSEGLKIAFQAAGKSLDTKLEPRFIIPASVLRQSISLAGKKVRIASATWQKTPTSTGAQRKNPFGDKKLSSLLVDAEFAGAVVTLLGSRSGKHDATEGLASPTLKSPQSGRFGQFANDGSGASTALRAPGVALKVGYNDTAPNPTLNIEFKVNASTNTLYPSVVPLIMDISDSVKEVVRDQDEPEDMTASKASQRFLDDEGLLTGDPSALLGKTKLNVGVRICRQEFTLSCEPIARVAATARFEDIYLTINSIKSLDFGHFVAASATFDKLQASVQHVYSRESTFSFDVESIVVSLMNSKHVSGTSGLSTILKIFPTRTQINGRQLQDFLLFREIWVPQEIRQLSKPPDTMSPAEPEEYLVQRYQEIASAAAFPWNATVTIAEMSVECDLGQAIGRPTFRIVNLWASSKKNSDWEQQLCVGVEHIGITSTGRMSGFVELDDFKIRTWISWPNRELTTRKTPLIQASVGFDRLKVKSGFDYQTFAMADVTAFSLIMYNVRDGDGSRDRLVAILDGGKVQVFCTSTTAAQGLALYQAMERLVQDNQTAYEQSLKDIERYLVRRKSATNTPSASQILPPPDKGSDTTKAPISLQTDVVVALHSVNFGVFPTTFSDSQVFIMAASDARARFAVTLEADQKIHSGLSLTLGRLSVALPTTANAAASSSSQHPTTTPKPAAARGSIGGGSDAVTVEAVVASALASRGGTILRVPKVVATMQTWQRAGSSGAPGAPDANRIDYIFKSAFEGKVDVGWNYNRISFIRSMWANHSRSLASRLGKPVAPVSAVKITTAGDDGGPDADNTGGAGGSEETQQAGVAAGADREKITAVVNVPQSRYEYVALEPPIIETPQLRDMGEATPPLEWIGLHRDRLPNVTHQIVIVTLLEIAREVEDAYSRILGSS